MYTLFILYIYTYLFTYILYTTMCVHTHLNIYTYIHTFRFFSTLGQLIAFEYILSEEIYTTGTGARTSSTRAYTTASLPHGLGENPPEINSKILLRFSHTLRVYLFLGFLYTILIILCEYTCVYIYIWRYICIYIYIYTV